MLCVSYRNWLCSAPEATFLCMQQAGAAIADEHSHPQPLGHIADRGQTAVGPVVVFFCPCILYVHLCHLCIVIQFLLGPHILVILSQTSCPSFIGRRSFRPTRNSHNLMFEKVSRDIKYYDFAKM